MTEAEIERALASLQRLAVDVSGWSILYRDPANGELWEITYPQSEMHGGGPRQLMKISRDHAIARYPGTQISN